jgi:hypothetical protein
MRGLGRAPRLSARTYCLGDVIHPPIFLPANIHNRETILISLMETSGSLRDNFFNYGVASAVVV